MPGELELAIVDALVKLGYKNVEHNLGTIWYTDGDGSTWSIGAQLCE